MLHEQEVEGGLKYDLRTHRSIAHTGTYISYQFLRLVS